MNTKFNRWVTCPFPQPEAALRLFCFPFAGGGASIYRAWGKLFGAAVEVCPIQLPGRENRFSEPAFKDAQALAQALASQLQLYSDKPFVMYGHSMGALVAFELARVLQANGMVVGDTVTVSATGNFRNAGNTANDKNVGTAKTKTLSDKWTVVTADAKRSAHFEHTVAITENGPRILTQPIG